MFWAEPIKHEGLTRATLGPNEEPVEMTIISPYAVSLRTTQLIEGVPFRFSAEVRRPKLTPADVTTHIDGVWRDDKMVRETDKSRRIADEARSWWTGVTEYLEDRAAEMLDEEPYATRQREIESFVCADLGSKVNVLKRAVGQLRERAAYEWLEVGSESTASMGNLDLAAAKAQAHLAAAVETYDACYGPYVSARSIAHELTRELPFRVSLYV